MKTGDKVWCKKNFYGRLGKLLFKKGECYEIKLSIYSSITTIWVWYNDESKKSNMKAFRRGSLSGSGYKFYEEVDSKFSDYFCNLSELRKIKLERLERLNDEK